MSTKSMSLLKILFVFIDRTTFCQFEKRFSSLTENSAICAYIPYKFIVSSKILPLVNRLKLLVGTTIYLLGKQKIIT